MSLVAVKEVKDLRRKICDSCENNKVGICSKCGCVIKLKVVVASSSCPLKKW